MTSRNRFQEKFSTKKSFGIGIKQIWYRKILRIGIEKFGTEKSLGIGLGKIWYQKKVTEPVLENFCIGANFRRQNLEILNIYNG